MFGRAKLILIIILLFAVCVTAYVIVVVIPTQLAQRSYEGAKQIGHDISEAFQFTPEITVNNTVVLQQQTPILELATLSQNFRHEYEWTNTRLGSTKKINIKGSFEAKAGFDLNKRFALEITDDKALVFLPKPQLLSIESLNDTKFEDEDGYWNWVNMDDRSMAINAFTIRCKKIRSEGGVCIKSPAGDGRQTTGNPEATWKGDGDTLFGKRACTAS